jgi:hypothetical protein
MTVCFILEKASEFKQISDVRREKESNSIQNESSSYSPTLLLSPSLPLVFVHLLLVLPINTTYRRIGRE